MISKKEYMHLDGVSDICIHVFRVFCLNLKLKHTALSCLRH